MSVDEAIASLEADPEYQAAIAKQEREAAEHAARVHAEERPIIEDLHKAGFKVKSLQEMHDRMTGKINTPAGALPILFEHLQRTYSPSVRANIAMRFSVPAARSYWNDLKQMCLAEKDEWAKHSFGNALLVVGLSDKSLLPEVIGMMRDKKRGREWSFFVRMLTRFSRDPRAYRALCEFRHDPRFGKQVEQYFRQRDRRQKAK